MFHTTTRIQRTWLIILFVIIWLVAAIAMTIYYAKGMQKLAEIGDDVFLGRDIHVESETFSYVFILDEDHEVQVDGSYIITQLPENAPEDGLQVGDRVLPSVAPRGGEFESQAILNVQRGDAPPMELTVQRIFEENFREEIIVYLSQRALDAGLQIGDMINSNVEWQNPNGTIIDIEVIRAGEGVLSYKLELTQAFFHQVYFFQSLGFSLEFAHAISMGLRFLLILSSFIVSGLIVWRRANDWMAILVALTLLLIPTIPLPLMDILWAKQVVAMLAPVIILSTFTLFPNGHLQPRWTVLVILGVFVLNFPPVIAFIQNLLSDTFELPTIEMFLGFLSLASPLAVQIYRYSKLFNQIERQQTKWLILISFFFTCTIAIRLIFSGLDSPNASITNTVAFLIGGMDLVLSVLWIALPFSILFAMLKYRLWNVDVVLNRSLVYGTVAVLTLLLFFVISTAMQMAFGNTSPIFALVASGGVSVFAFRPVRNGTQRLVDRYIYGLRFDLNELKRVQRPLKITNPGKLTGQQFGCYEVGGVLGKGGMGEVYEGFGNDRRVAIKTMLAEIARDPEMKTRFEREVEIGMALKSPKIVEVYAGGEHEGTPYLVMEYIEGQNLSELITLCGQLDEETTTQIIQDVCQALSVAHAQGFVHRDIKPSNIMLRNNGVAVLMDFGISKIQNAKTITGTGAVGTIQYMAPEQIISSKDVDHRADIYALGCVMYQMLAGETPFTGGAAQVMFAHIQQPAPDIREHSPEIADTLAEVILKALEKAPDNRFSSAEALASALSA